MYHSHLETYVQQYISCVSSIADDISIVIYHCTGHWPSATARLKPNTEIKQAVQLQNMRRVKQALQNLFKLVGALLP